MAHCTFGSHFCSAAGEVLIYLESGRFASVVLYGQRFFFYVSCLDWTRDLPTYDVYVPPGQVISYARVFHRSRSRFMPAF